MCSAPSCQAEAVFLFLCGAALVGAPAAFQPQQKQGSPFRLPGCWARGTEPAHKISDGGLALALDPTFF